MYEKLTIRQSGSLQTFIGRAKERIKASPQLEARLRDNAIDAIKRVGHADLNVNQVVYTEGVRRWCSDLLSQLIPIITSTSAAYCQANGGADLGLNSRDIRAVHAIILYRTLMDTDLHVSFARKRIIWPEAPEAWSQWMDYLRHKSRSRPAVNNLLGAIDVPPIAPPAQHPSVEALETINQLYQKETYMSLGAPISPFNFSRPAIEEIKFVYGISVKELTLDRVTALLTERQAEVDRLKALPHKPEVIKAQITKLKGEIRDLLALANELFPVVE